MKTMILCDWIELAEVTTLKSDNSEPDITDILEESTQNRIKEAFIDQMSWWEWLQSSLMKICLANIAMKHWATRNNTKDEVKDIIKKSLTLKLIID